VSVAEAPHRVQSASNLAWLDLEMTGLDPVRDVILQAALIVTDAELTPLEEYCSDVWQPPAALAGMTPFVRDMHEKTGLLERIGRCKSDLRVVEKQLIERIAGWCAYPAVLCGNSIGQDRRFLDVWMPGLSGYLGYRIVDVSSIKVLARRWYGPGGTFEKPNAGEHDALFDIRQSLDELRFYRQTIFR
jgi:oligoribonuclease